MSAFMESILGASWRTSIFGLVGGVFYYFQSSGVTLPHDLHGWINTLIAAGIFAWGRVQKDTNVSNAPKPDAAKPVS